jgi:hypothetical protein
MGANGKRRANTRWERDTARCERQTLALASSGRVHPRSNFTATGVERCAGVVRLCCAARRSTPACTKTRATHSVWAGLTRAPGHAQPLARSAGTISARQRAHVDRKTFSARFVSPSAQRLTLSSGARHVCCSRYLCGSHGQLSNVSRNVSRHMLLQRVSTLLVRNRRSRMARSKPTERSRTCRIGRFERSRRRA